MAVIHWFPGHMAKAKRQLAGKLSAVDLVIVVCDARAPAGTFDPGLPELAKGKAMLVVLNKSDLAEREATDDWIRHYTASGLRAMAFSCVRDRPETIRRAIGEAARDILESYRKKGANKTVRAMVAGVPNTGKTALVNRIYGRKRLKEGNLPGVTRGLSWLKITPYLELLDTPGVLPPRLDDRQAAFRLAVLGAIREEVLPVEEIALALIAELAKSRPSMLESRYGVPAADKTPLEILVEICKKRGFLAAKGEYDVERGARTLLDEFQAGKLGRITMERPGTGY